MPALPLETRNAILQCGLERSNILADVGNHPAEAGVEFARPGSAGHFRDVSRLETTTRQDPDAIASLLDERSKNGRAG